MPLVIGVKLITHILEEKQKQQAWDMWLTKYPNMSENDFMPFSIFYQKVSQEVVKKPQKTAEELIKTAIEIRKRIAEGHYKNENI